MPVPGVAPTLGNKIKMLEEIKIELNSVRCNGFTLNYSMEGQGELAVLVVGSSIFYPRTFSRRLKESFRFVFADLPHFVEIEPGFDLASIGFDIYAECIERIRIAAGLERVVIMGHSHHGNIAVEYARRFPQHVSHVVLIGTPPVNIAQTIECAKQYWHDNAPTIRKTLLAKRRALRDERDLPSQNPREAYITQYVTDAPLYWHDPEYDAAWLWSGMRFRMDAVHAFRSLYEKYEMQLGPGEFTAPVLAIMGRDDYAVPHTLWSRRRIPSSVDIRILDRSGHTPQLEQPEEFDRILLAWLSQNGVGGP